MEIIDLESWHRKKHFETFNGMDFPQYNICAEVDISQLQRFAKDHSISSFALVVYMISKTANGIEAFRLRARGDTVVRHDSVHPSFTVPTKGDLFAYCTLGFCEDLNAFVQQVADGIQQATENPSLEDTPGRDDYLFMSCLPWIRFTSISHAIHLSPMDSIPRISWGKYVKENNKVLMPLSLQVHHGLVDGLHLGQFYEQIQDNMDNITSL